MGRAFVPFLVPAATAEVDHDLHIHRVHNGHQLVQILLRHLVLVVVDIDKRIFRAGRDVFLHFQGRNRVVFLEAKRGFYHLAKGGKSSDEEAKCQ